MEKLVRFPYLAVLLIAASFLLLSHEPLSAQTTPPFYYYYHGARVPLTLDPTHVAVRFKPDTASGARRDIVTRSGDISSADPRVEVNTLNVEILPVLPAHDPLSAVTRLQNQPGVQAAGPVFSFKNGSLYAEIDEFIVRYKSGTTQAAIDALNRANGAEVVRSQAYSKGVVLMRPGAGNTRSALELANAYAQSVLVEFAEPNFVMVQPRPHEPNLQSAPRVPGQPTDPDFGAQWSLYNSGQYQGAIAGVDINALGAWQVTNGASQITIAVMDEGVDGTHPDLQGKLLTGINVTVQPNDTNTQPSTPNEYHGTASAGIAAAATNNGKGIAGVCWMCMILPVKVAYEDSSGNWVTSTAELAAGIDWAWQNGADVLSNSWTVSGPSDDITGAIFNAWTAGRNGLGSTLVFASGNEDVQSVSFPASLDYVLGVGASTWCDQRKTETNDRCNDNEYWWGSNYGPELDVVAPGEALYTTCNGNQCAAGNYTYFSGTSASTPLVAGAVGLLYSLNPNLTPTDVRTVLQRGAKYLPPTYPDTGSGYYRLDASRSIAALYDLALTASRDQFMPRVGDTVRYTLSYANAGLTTMSSTYLSVTIPAGLTYVRSNPTFTNQGSYYRLDLGSLAQFGSGIAHLAVQVAPGTEGQSLSLRARIAGAYPELNYNNNNAVDTVTVARGIQFLPLIMR